MKKTLFILLFVPLVALSQTFNASKQIVRLENKKGIIKITHIDSSKTEIPKASIGFLVCYPLPQKSVQFTTISGGSNNYTFGFAYDAVLPIFVSQYAALDTLSSWIAQNITGQ